MKSRKLHRRAMACLALLALLMAGPTVARAQSSAIGSELDVHVGTVQRSVEQQAFYKTGTRACHALERMGPRAESAVPVLAEAVRCHAAHLPSGIMREGESANIEFRHAAAKALAAIGRRPDVAVPALTEAVERWPQDAVDYQAEQLGSIRRDLPTGPYYEDVEGAYGGIDVLEIHARRMAAFTGCLHSMMDCLAVYGAESGPAVPALAALSSGTTDHMQQTFDAQGRFTGGLLRAHAIKTLGAIAAPNDREAVVTLQRIAYYEVEDRNLQAAARRALEQIKRRPERPEVDDFAPPAESSIGGRALGPSLQGELYDPARSATEQAHFHSLMRADQEAAADVLQLRAHADWEAFRLRELEHKTERDQNVFSGGAFYGPESE